MKTILKNHSKKFDISTTYTPSSLTNNSMELSQYSITNESNNISHGNNYTTLPLNKKYKKNYRLNDTLSSSSNTISSTLNPINSSTSTPQSSSISNTKLQSKSLPNSSKNNSRFSKLYSPSTTTSTSSHYMSLEEKEFYGIELSNDEKDYNNKQNDFYIKYILNKNNKNSNKTIDLVNYDGNYS